MKSSTESSSGSNGGSKGATLCDTGTKGKGVPSSLKATGIMDISDWDVRVIESNRDAQ